MPAASLLQNVTVWTPLPTWNGALYELAAPLSTLAGIDRERKDRLHILSIVDEYAFGALLTRHSPDHEDAAITAASEFIGQHLDPERFPHSFALMRAGEDPVETTRAVFVEMHADDPVVLEPVEHLGHHAEVLVERLALAVARLVVALAQDRRRVRGRGHERREL